MAGFDIPPSLGPQGQSTTAVTSPSSTSSVSQKVLTPEGLQAEIDSLQAQKDALAAQASPGPAPDTEGADLTTPGAMSPLAADLASREQSALATPKNAEAVPPPKSPEAAYQDVISQALKGNPAGPDPVDMSDREAPRFTSQQLAQGAGTTPGLRPPQTLAAAQDEAAADMARQKATAAQAFQAEQARIEAQKQKDMQAAYQEIQRLAADKEKNTHITSLYEDMSTPRRILSALAVGFGAYGAGLTGGPNTAAQMLQKEMDQDLERKKFKVQNYLQQMKAAGARPEQIRRMAEDSQKHLLATQQAQLNTIEAQAKQVLAPFPQAQQQAQALLAGKREEMAKDQRNFAMELAQTKGRTAESGHTVSTSMEGGVPRNAPNSIDVQSFERMKDNAKLAARLLDLQKKGQVPTPEMVREYEQNENVIIQRAEAEQKGGKPSQLWSNTLRTLGAIPENTYPEGATKEQKEYLDLSTVLGHYRVFTMGGQTALASPQARAAIMGPGQGGAGESNEDRIRKDAAMAREFVAAGKTAEEVSKAGMQEQRVERATAKQLTSAQIARAPATDRTLYIRAKSNSNPTPTQKAFVSKFEAAYGR